MITEFFLQVRPERFLIAICCISLIFCATRCTKMDGNKEVYLTDSVSLQSGEILFSRNCSACHTFLQDGIGPDLSGITELVPKAWLREFIRHPQQYIDAGDARAVSMQAKFKSVMPSFEVLSDTEIDFILAYLNIHKGHKTDADTIGSLNDPIPGSILPTPYCVELEEVVTIPASGPADLPTRITKLYSDPVTSDVFVLDLRGKLYNIRNGVTTVYFDISKERPAFINTPGLATGFGSFAFHPEFRQNGLLYTTHAEPAGTRGADFSYADTIPVQLQWVVTEWKTKNPSGVPFVGIPREILRLDMVSGIHGLQEIAFNPNARVGDPDYGLLYLGIGDAGSVENGFPSLVTAEDAYLGTVFRIDPAGRNSANGQYGISPFNPFVVNGHRRAEIFAYGFRNPHRITWLRSGEMLVNNIGQRHIESLYVVESGANHGWPSHEGSFVIRNPRDINRIYDDAYIDTVMPIRRPVIEYDHDEGLAIAGGYEYQGKAVGALNGKFVFGDIVNGRVFVADVADIRSKPRAEVQELRLCINGVEKTLRELVGQGRIDLRLGRDEKGELYLLTKRDGKVRKLVDGEATAVP